MVNENDKLKAYLMKNLSEYELPMQYERFEDVFGHLDEDLMTEELCMGLLRIDFSVIYEIPLSKCTKSILYYGINGCIINNYFQDRIWLYAYLLYEKINDLNVFDYILLQDISLRKDPFDFFTEKEKNNFMSKYPLCSDSESFEKSLIAKLLYDRNIKEYIIPKRSHFTVEDVRKAYYDHFKVDEKFEATNEEISKMQEEEYLRKREMQRYIDEGYISPNCFED